MGYRKIIGFGDSSFVVSLPKHWVINNKLNKGDDVSLDIDSNIIRIYPANQALETSNTAKEITIEFSGNLLRFKAELIYAYVNNFNVINIHGEQALQKDMKKIREIIDSLAALEVVQQTSNKLVLKDFLNIADVAPYDLIRRLDRIILSMSEDVFAALNGDMENTLELLDQKEHDSNKLANLMFKVLKRTLNPACAMKIGVDLDDIFYYWELSLFMEKVADQLKRIPRHLDGKINPKVIEAYKDLIEQYKLAMKANYTKDVQKALDVIAYKGEVFRKLDYAVDKLPRDYIYFLEKMRSINILNGNIAKALLKMGLREEKK